MQKCRWSDLKQMSAIFQHPFSKIYRQQSTLGKRASERINTIEIPPFHTIDWTNIIIPSIVLPLALVEGREMLNRRQVCRVGVLVHSTGKFIHPFQKAFVM